MGAENDGGEGAEATLRLEASGGQLGQKQADMLNGRLDAKRGTFATTNFNGSVVAQGGRLYSRCLCDADQRRQGPHH